MAGVRRIKDHPLRYLVTHTHPQLLDDAELAVVERIPGLFNKPYFVCLMHEAKDCKCIAAVHGFREATGTSDLADEG